MKDKTLGWGHQSPRICFADGCEIFDTQDTILWNKIYYSQLITRPSCHLCRFTNLHRSGDITLGDYWGIKSAHPDFYDNRGISLVLLNTPQGKDLFEKIAHKLICKPSSLKLCTQPNLAYPASENPMRGRFWNDYEVLSFRKLCKRYWGYGKWNWIRQKLRQMLTRLRT